MTLSWNETKRLDLARERNNCQIDVKREKFFSEETDYVSKNQLLSVKASEKKDFEILGEIPANRPLIPYIDVFDWINNHLSGFDLENKMIASRIEGKYHALFQQYLFNIDIETPDKEHISPSLFLRSSYYGPRPALEIHFGAFRYICSNGMVSSYKGVKESFFSINSRSWKGLNKVNLRLWLERGLEQSGAMAVVFKKLNNISLNEKKNEIFSNKTLPMGLRKKTLGCLEFNGNMEVTVENDKRRTARLKANLLKERHLEKDLIERHLHLEKDISLWELYNNFTNIATENSMTSAKFITDSQRVNEVFNKITA